MWAFDAFAMRGKTRYKASVAFRLILKLLHHSLLSLKHHHSQFCDAVNPARGNVHHISEVWDKLLQFRAAMFSVKKIFHFVTPSTLIASMNCMPQTLLIQFDLIFTAHI